MLAHLIYDSVKICQKKEERSFAVTSKSTEYVGQER